MSYKLNAGQERSQHGDLGKNEQRLDDFVRPATWSTRMQNAVAQYSSNQIYPIAAHRQVLDHVVTRVFSINLKDLERSSRGRAKVALARQVAMYLAHVTCGLTFTQIGAMFGRDRTTVAHACAVVEDRRDDLQFDRVVQMMENAVLNMLCFPSRERSR